MTNLPEVTHIDRAGANRAGHLQHPSVLATSKLTAVSQMRAAWEAPQVFIPGGLYMIIFIQKVALLMSILPFNWSLRKVRQKGSHFTNEFMELIQSLLFR